MKRERDELADMMKSMRIKNNSELAEIYCIDNLNKLPISGNMWSKISGQYGSYDFTYYHNNKKYNISIQLTDKDDIEDYLNTISYVDMKFIYPGGGLKDFASVDSYDINFLFEFFDHNSILKLDLGCYTEYIYRTISGNYLIVTWL